MLQAPRILLASHGTPGARAADRKALELCRGPGAVVFHLTVVPDLWRGMMGDDWLSNASTRDAYCKHLESQLGTEIDEHRRTLEPEVIAAGARYEARTAIGKPAECLLEFAVEVSPELVVIGSPRPAGTPGLRSRMQAEKLIKSLTVPLLVVPYPR